MSEREHHRSCCCQPQRVDPPCFQHLPADEGAERCADVYGGGVEGEDDGLVLGLKEAQALLEQTLAEESTTNADLTSLADSYANKLAA